MTHVEIGMLLGSGVACGILVLGLLRLGLISIAKRGQEANAGSIEMVEASRKADLELSAAKRRLNEAKQEWDEAEESLENARENEEQATDALEGLRTERTLKKKAHHEAEVGHTAAEKDAVRKKKEASSIKKAVRDDVLDIAEREKTHAEQRVRLKQAALNGFASGMSEEAKQLKSQLKSISGQWQVIITVTATAIVLAGEVLYYAHFDINVFDYYSMNSLSGVVDAVYFAAVAVISVVVTYLLVHVNVRGGVWGRHCWISTRGAFRVCAARARTEVLKIFFATFGRLAGLLRYLLRKALKIRDAGYKVPETRKEEELDKYEEQEQEKGEKAARTWFGRVRAAAMTLSIVAVAAFVMLFEPRYRAHTTCTGTRSVGVVVEPALGKRSEFVRIGSMGGYVFAMPLESVALVAPKNEQRPPNRQEKNLATVIRDGYRQVRDAVVRRAQFLASRNFVVGGIECPGDVVAVPQNRVLCVHDRLATNGSEVCVPAAAPVIRVGDAAAAAGARSGVVSGPCGGRRGQLGAARVPALGLGRRALAAAAGAAGGGLGTASGPAAAGDLPRQRRATGGLPLPAQ